jgi:uncharacterized DUF497 family protein
LEEYFEWSDEKNELLKDTRGISFEDVVLSLSSGKLLDKIKSPTHKNQECYVLEINDYVYIIPFAKDEKKVFLKTIYPSRKHTKYYLKD